MPDPDLHKGWRLEYDPPPVPTRSHDWAATPPDYDGEGIVLYGETREAVVAEIDQWLAEEEVYASGD